MTDEWGSYYILDDNETVTEGVTAAVAAAKNEDGTTLPPLYDVIDPDSLDSLFETGTDDIRVVFQYAGYYVRVNGEGRVALAEASDEHRENLLGECGHCGAEFQFDVDYPVTTREVDGQMTFFSFCDIDCKDEWESDRRKAVENDD